MKDLKKITREDLKSIVGGAQNLGDPKIPYGSCPSPSSATTCAQWCKWDDLQKANCANMVIDQLPCSC